MEFIGFCKSSNSWTYQLYIELDPEPKWCLQNSVFLYKFLSYVALILSPILVAPFSCSKDNRHQFLELHASMLKVKKNNKDLYTTISRNHSGVHSDWTGSVHVLIFYLITDARLWPGLGPSLHSWVKGRVNSTGSTEVESGGN